MAARSRGEADINKIYGDIIRHLARPQSNKGEDKPETLNSTITELQELAARNQPFTSLGLTTELPAKHMAASLKDAPHSAKAALLNVLRPYVDSVKARLDALEGVQTVISQFVEALNSFLAKPKRVHFDLTAGLTIRGYDGVLLQPDSLSSGERQLLTIFCQILRPRDHAAVFIIDEPELSLNIKWQRRLLQSLLDCTQGAPIQFLMASHSMEMLARHKQQVVVMQSETNV